MHARRIILLALCATSLAHAQERKLTGTDIRIYSEFERFNPFGEPVAADRDMRPREVLSPAMPRNGHMSVHVVITAPPDSNFFLYASTNPPGILKVQIYREFFARCGNDFCPDWLVPQSSPTFGAMPELAHNPDYPALDRQNTRCYLLDIRSTADTPPRRVRVEALLKVGTWLVAPMEVRIVAPTVPVIPAGAAKLVREDIAPIDAPSADTAGIQLFRYLAGMPPEWPRQLLRVRDFIQRNAAEDMLLARSLEGQQPRVFPEMNLLAWAPFVYPHSGAGGLGAEWYLKIRDFLYRFEP